MKKIEILNTTISNGPSACHDVKFCVDPDDGKILMWSANNGGPIVKDDDLVGCKLKFLEGLIVIDAVRNLEYFTKHGKFPDKINPLTSL